MKFYNIKVDKEDRMKGGKKTKWKWDSNMLTGDLSLSKQNMYVEKMGSSNWAGVFGT